MSVSVIDHMPPSTEYSTTTLLPSRMAALLSMLNNTEKIEPYAMVEVTAMKRA